MRSQAMLALVLCQTMAFAAAPAPDAAGPETSVMHDIELLNQVPQTELNDKTDPGFSIIRHLHDQDGPDFLTLRKLLGKAEVRSRLNPSAKGLLAGILSQRWDTFALCGNLWLAALQSKNPEIRAKARKRLVVFIQPAHIPELIELLRVPGPNILAYEVLQEVTQRKLEPKAPVWRAWWAKTGGKVDLVGNLLADTKNRLLEHPISGFEQDRFWYAPDEVKDTHVQFDKLSPAEQRAVTRWNDWANSEVKGYLTAWSDVKPVLDRVIHQPDPRVNMFLVRLISNPGYGDYACIVLAWRANRESLQAIQDDYAKHPTVGRALARGSLGDKSALNDLLTHVEKNANPLSFGIMDDTARATAQTLHTVGVLPAEQAFELLAHHSFDFDGASTRGDKKKSTKAAKRWLKEHQDTLVLDRRRGFFTSPSKK